MLITSFTAVRDADGISITRFNETTGSYIPPLCSLNNNCEFGLRNDYNLMTTQGAWSPLIIIGVFSTTLSSASGCLIGAPRIFQVEVFKFFLFIFFLLKKKVSFK